MTDTPTPRDSPTPPASLPRWRWRPAGVDWRPKVRWFAAEYLIVVLGVLTAVGINAWWGGVQERADERETLQALQAEFTVAQETILRYRAMHRRVLASTASVSDSLDRAMDRGAAQTTVRDTALALTLMQGTVSVRLGTLEGLIDSGRLGILRNRILRAALGAWDGSLADVTEEEVEARGKVSGDLDHALRTRIHSSGLWETASRLIGGGDAAPTDGRPVALPVDTDLAGLMHQRKVHLAFMVREYAGLIDEVDLILRQIEASLDGSASPDSPGAPTS